MPLIEEGFPEFYVGADGYSDDWQKRYLWSERVQLVALLLAAMSAVGGPRWGPVLLFALAVSAQVFRLVMRADERWWNGRAAAESVKTAAWLYVSGGAPYEREDGRADVKFAEAVRDIARDVADHLPVASGSPPVTAAMRRARERPLEQRIEDYLQQRVRGQCEWYASKAKDNRRWSYQWSLAAIAAQAAGLAFGIAALAAGSSLDIVGAFSAMGAAIVAWIAIKQFAVLTRAYAVASHELGTIDIEIQSADWSEADWARFVNEAEEAISREHTAWRASKAV